ncbi:hypothetical protein OB920_18960 [Halobacteria archaeon HArc-gm2]|nr:hypothetical protein [Halobacteria archaeon HArc-gm2]
MDGIEIAFEFERPLEASEISNLFRKCASRGFSNQADDHDSETIYIGESTDHLPEIVDFQEALERIERDGQGALQLRYGEIDILFSVNPETNSVDVTHGDSFLIVGSVDEVYFRDADIFGAESQVSDRVSDLVDAVATFGMLSLPDRIVGYPTDQRGNPEPELIRTSFEGDTVPVHWLTLLPTKTEQRPAIYTDTAYSSHRLDELGTLLVLTEDPGDTAAIEAKRNKLIT